MVQRPDGKIVISHTTWPVRPLNIAKGWEENVELKTISSLERAAIYSTVITAVLVT
jgi:hypothetical protein